MGTPKIVALENIPKIGAIPQEMDVGSLPHHSRFEVVSRSKVDCRSTRQRTRYEQFSSHLYEANADLAVAASGGLTWVINITPAHIAISA